MVLCLGNHHCGIATAKGKCAVLCLLIVIQTVYLCDSKLFHVSYIDMYFIFGILMSFAGGGGVSKQVYNIYLSSSKHKLQTRIKSHLKKT